MSSQIFKAGDYSKRSIAVTAKSLTSGLPIVTDSPQCLIEIEGESLTLGVPANSCSQGHRLMVSLKSKKGLSTKPITCEVTGRVTDLESGPSGQAKIKFKMEQYDKHIWKQIAEALDEDLIAAAELFRKMRE